MANITKFNDIVADNAIINSEHIVTKDIVNKIKNEYENPYYEQTMIKVKGSQITLDVSNCVVDWGDGNIETFTTGPKPSHTYKNINEVHYITVRPNSGKLSWGSPIVYGDNIDIILVKFAGDSDQFSSVTFETEFPNAEIWFTPGYIGSGLESFGHSKAGIYRCYGPVLDTARESYLTCANKIYVPMEYVETMRTAVDRMTTNGQSIEVIPMLINDNVDPLIEWSTENFVTVGATNSTSSSQVIYENKEFRNGINIGGTTAQSGNKYKQFTNSLDTLWNKNVYPNWPVYSFSYPAYEYPSSYPITMPIQIQYPLASGTLATQEWVNAQNFGGGGSIDTSNLVYLASTTDRTEQTVSLITRMKDIYFGTMSGVTTGYSDKHLCAKGFMDDRNGTWLLFPDDWAKGSKTYDDTIATEGWIWTNCLTVDLGNDREVCNLGHESWTAGSTTWYESEECDDNSAEQYVRISPLGPGHYANPESEFYITARYNENEFLGLNPWGVHIQLGEQNSATFTTRGVTVWYDDPDSTNGAEAYNLNFPVGMDYSNGDCTLATEEYVDNRLIHSVPKIYATESGTTTVGTLRVYTDSDGYLHIKTS